MVDLGEPAPVAFLLQQRLEFGHPVEVILQRALVAAGDQQHVAQASPDGLFDDVLNGRLVHDR